MKPVGIAAGACVLILAAVIASAQSLGDIAKQEAERRKSIKSSGKVYTNDNVHSEPTSAAPAAPAATEPAPPAAAVQPKSGAPVPADDPKTEAYWKKRITAARDSLSRAQTFAEALQTRINSLSADFVNRDDPAQRNLIAADRQKATDELVRVKTDIAQFQKTIADIQDEARRANVPAGWVR